MGVLVEDLLALARIDELRDPVRIPVDVAALAADAVEDVRATDPGRPIELFERFWRAEGGRRRGKAGAGLGLAIVAAIVERHEGRVEAADAEGGGARFTVRLPALARSGGTIRFL